MRFSPRRPPTAAVLPVWGLSVLAVCFLSLAPRVELPFPPPWHADKAAHFAAYLWLGLLPPLGLALRRARAASLSMILLGLALELIQSQVPGRMCSWADLAANTGGVLAGLALGEGLARRFFPGRA